LQNAVNLNYLFRRCLNADYKKSGLDANYAVTRSGRRIYIFFEWSDGIGDWKNNLDFPARAHGGGDAFFVHRGFLRVWRSIRLIIENEVNAVISNNKINEIVCVGYSHGAALAGLCTEELVFSLGGKISVSGYGFGCPRFIFGRLPKEIKVRFSSFLPVRNVPDLVTYLPPRILGYFHPSPVLEIGERGKYSPIRAHFPESYLAETKNIVP